MSCRNGATLKLLKIVIYVACEYLSLQCVLVAKQELQIAPAEYSHATTVFTSPQSNMTSEEPSVRKRDKIGKTKPLPILPLKILRLWNLLEWKEGENVYMKYIKLKVEYKPEQII